MHNAQCRGNGVAESAVVAELVEATNIRRSFRQAQRPPSCRTERSGVRHLINKEKYCLTKTYKYE